MPHPDHMLLTVTVDPAGVWCDDVIVWRDEITLVCDFTDDADTPASPFAQTVRFRVHGPTPDLYKMVSIDDFVWPPEARRMIARYVRVWHDIEGGGKIVVPIESPVLFTAGAAIQIRAGGIIINGVTS